MILSYIMDPMGLDSDRSFTDSLAGGPVRFGFINNLAKAKAPSWWKWIWRSTNRQLEVIGEKRGAQHSFINCS